MMFQDTRKVNHWAAVRTVLSSPFPVGLVPFLMRLKKSFSTFLNSFCKYSVPFSSGSSLPSSETAGLAFFSGGLAFFSGGLAFFSGAAEEKPVPRNKPRQAQIHEK